jgi:hypothetical protein
MFTTGRIIFMLCFALVFIGGIAWAYRKDLKVSKIHYKGVLWVLFGIVAIFGILFLIVKFRHKV